jgi:IS66 orf2 like protein
MRKGFDRLCGVVRESMGCDPLCGEVFIFINRERNRIKLLHWERGGFVIYHKRLERGRLTLPKLDPASGNYPMQWCDLVLMVEGIPADVGRRKKRYTFPLENIANNY